MTTECKKCGLLKSTIDATGKECVDGEHDQYPEYCHRCGADWKPSCVAHGDIVKDMFESMGHKVIDVKATWETELHYILDCFKADTNEERAIEAIRILRLASYEEGADSMRNKVQWMQGYAEGRKDGEKAHLTMSGDERYELGLEEGRRDGRGNISALRQWLNERTETRLITNEDIVTFLDL